MSAIGSSSRGNQDKLFHLKRKENSVRRKIQFFNSHHNLPTNEGYYSDGNMTPRTSDIIERSIYRLSEPKDATELMLIGRRDSHEDNMYDLLISDNFEEGIKPEIGYYSSPLTLEQEMDDVHLDSAYYIADKLYDFILEKKLITPNSYILDIGSGLGYFVDAINQDTENNGIRAVGIEPRGELIDKTEITDNISGMLDGANEKIEGLKDDQTFDRIFMNAPFTSLNKSDVNIKTIKKYLADDGKLILSIPTNDLMETVFCLKKMQNDRHYNPRSYLGNLWDDNKYFMNSAIQFAEALHEHFNVDTIYDAITEKEKTGVNELIGGGFAFVVVLTPKN